MNDVSVPLIRHVGPTAWAVLELMRHKSRADEGEAIAPVTIRTLAADLGLAKNTVHRAVRRLRDAGLIEPHQLRSRAGTFAAGQYSLTGTSVDMPTADTTVAADEVREPSPAASTTATSALSGQRTLGI